MSQQMITVFSILVVLSTGISGCLETACDIRGEIDNSLGYDDEIIVHLIIKECKTCPWQVKASAFAYKGVETFCFVADGDAKIVFDDAKQYLKGDEVSDDVGHEITAGEYKFTVDESGLIKDDDGNVYSFF